MKKILKLRTAILLAMCVVFSLTLFSGCSDDDNGGSKGDVRDSYVGTYSARYSFVYQGVQIFDDYILTVTKSQTDENTIIMSNISDYNYVAARATVQGNSFSIPQQTFIALGISGSGMLNGNTLTFSTSETHTDYVGAINVSHTATKQ